VDPFDRFNLRSLDEVLVAQGLLSREKADELMQAASEANESFAGVLLEAGVVTPWDLAKVVATTYQLPVHPLSGYKFDKGNFEGIPAELMHHHRFLPIGQFGMTRTFAVVVPPSRELLDRLQAICHGSVHFFVAEEPEISRALRDHVKVVDTEKDSGWQKLFDSAEEEVLKDRVGAPRPA
jgi:hypothetical protein